MQVARAASDVFEAETEEIVGKLEIFHLLQKKAGFLEQELIFVEQKIIFQFFFLDEGDSLQALQKLFEAADFFKVFYAVQDGSLNVGNFYVPDFFYAECFLSFYALEEILVKHERAERFLRGNENCVEDLI